MGIIKFAKYCGTFYLLIMISCKDNYSKKSTEDKTQDLRPCNNLKFIPHYYDLLGDSSNASYDHYIYVKNFQEECFNGINFIRITKNYIDTCKNKIPVSFITYVSSIDKFDRGNADYQDWKIIRKNELVSFYVNSNNKKDGKQIFELEAIEFYNGDKRRVIKIE